MATFTEDSGLAGTVPTTSTENSVIIQTVPRPPPFLPPFFKQPTSTLSPGHQDILDMHANSQSNAIIYVLVVLGLYVLAMTIVVIKYIRTERYEARLTRLFQNIVQRDHFFRLSRRRSSVPKCIPGVNSANIIEDDLPLSPIIHIPDITATVPTPELSDPIEDESKV